MATKLGARGSCSLTVTAMNVQGINLELFEYADAERLRCRAGALKSD
ncbi:hypothetical protein ANMWB30_00970 [Arthrobacter sp. MWB30]|nr:hypothetical protein ANMWB30_00970 [Arthrobacter sp. MWB30]